MIVGSICARGGSKGIPRKALRMLGSHPLIGHAIRCAQECQALEHVIVSTDDREIAEVAREYGAEVPFLRPPSLAEDDSPKWEVFRHAVEAYERIKGHRIEMLVDLDVSVPLRPSTAVADCIEDLRTSDADLVVTAYRADRNPYFNMVEVGDDGVARIVKPPARPVHNRQAATAVYALSPAVYAMRRDALWRFEHWSEAKMRIHVVPRAQAWDADGELDFRIVEFLMGGQFTA